MRLIKTYIVLAFWSCFCGICAQEKNKDTPRLESPYFVYPRTGSQHIDISADWELTSVDSPIKVLSDLTGKERFNVAEPTSIQMAYYKAGKMPAPYEHLNSNEYTPLEQKIHYYRKSFATPTMNPDDYVILSFDGIDYTSRIWLNGTFIGEHSGMFGGPSVNVNDFLKKDDSMNELIVEVRSANYGNPSYISRTPKSFVRSWFFSHSDAAPFFHLGMWNTVRLDVLPHYHLERPFLVTRKIENGKAIMDFTTEIFAGKNSNDYTLHPWGNEQMEHHSTPFTYVQDIKVKDDIRVKVFFNDGNRVAYSKDFRPHVIEGRCWMEESFELDNPKLWYPNQLGEQPLYQVSVQLAVNGRTVDNISFDFGIRTIEQVRSAGLRVRDRWANWQFVINGKKIFVKGVNWMPLDALSNLQYDDYEWAIKAAKNAGIQMFRIWGTGYLETEKFYDLCNKYGIMVWQDFTIANFDTPEWPQDIWEAQVCHNIFRLRNQPSLAVWCGGNEFNPYSFGNTASIGTLERNIREFDPTRIFLRTSPDGGSMHSYPDFDPNWYKAFTLIPYVSETGIHTMSAVRGNLTTVAASDIYDLGKMYDKDFASKHPDFIHHFAEYSPSRVPRMLSRGTHIDNMKDPSYEDIVEATQVGSGEFYQIMSEGLQSNYPVTTGLMPWVFKRPWPVVAAIQLVDYFGQPTAPYYFLKRTYEPVHIVVDLPRLLYAPGETVHIKTNVLNGVNCPAFKGIVNIKILDDKFNELKHFEQSVEVNSGTAVAKSDVGDFMLPNGYKEQFFFIVAILTDENGQFISQSVYWPRTIKQMENREFYEKYCNEPLAWPTLDNGPWLKPTIAKSKTTLSVSNMKRISDNSYSFTISNIGKYPSAMTCIDVENKIFYANDNFFWLEPKTSKEIIVNIKQEESNQDKISVISWNAKSIIFKIK